MKKNTQIKRDTEKKLCDTIYEMIDSYEKSGILLDDLEITVSMVRVPLLGFGVILHPTVRIKVKI